MTGESTLIRAITSLATIDLHMNLREGSLEHQLNLTTLPLLGQRKIRLIQALLIGNTLRCRLTIEPHAILVGAKALQFPTRWYTNLRPLATIAPVRALENPLHHVVTTVSAQILTLSLHQSLGLDGHCHHQRPRQKNRPSHLSVSLFLIKTNARPFCHYRENGFLLPEKRLLSLNKSYGCYLQSLQPAHLLSSPRKRFSTK